MNKIEFIKLVGCTIVLVSFSERCQVVSLTKVLTEVEWLGYSLRIPWLFYFIFHSLCWAKANHRQTEFMEIFVSCSLPLKVNGEKELSIMLSLLFLQTRITFIELNWSNELDESCLIEMIQQACKWILNVLKLIKGMYLLFIIRC